jgi:succinoglycan biosynthesis transport protein ExoP
MTRDYFQLLMRHWILILAAVIVGGLVGGGIALATPRSYEASASVYFSVTSATSATDLNQAAAYAQSQMSSFAILATSDTVLNDVKTELGLTETTNQLSGSIRATTPDQTTVLNISADSSSPARAADVANSVASNLVLNLSTVVPTTAKTVATVSPRVVSSATAPKSPTGPNTKLNIIAGLVLGLLAGLAFALMRSIYDTTVRNPRDAAAAAHAPVLARIENDPDLGLHDVATSERPESRAANDFRLLRAAIRGLATGRSSFSFVISSATAGEGKSVLAANLAAALSEADAKIVLVDANLRSPSLATLFDSPDGPGLSGVLRGDATLDDATVSTTRNNFDLIPAGRTSSAASQLLTTRGFTAAIESLKKKYDIVIVDSPSLDEAADAVTIARHFDGALLVVRSGVPKSALVTRLADNLEAAGTPILGVILNRSGKAPRRKVVKTSRSLPTAPPPALKGKSPEADEVIASEAVTATVAVPQVEAPIEPDLSTDGGSGAKAAGKAPIGSTPKSTPAE